MLQKSQNARSSTQCKSGPGNYMVCRRNYLLHIFQLQFPSTSPVFMQQNTSEKKIGTVRGMLVEQLFELRGPGPPGHTCTPITGCFHDKIISKENIRLDLYLLRKYCRRQCTLLPPTCAKSLTKFNPKMQDFKRALDLNCK